jgi:hypothetical protein
MSKKQKLTPWFSWRVRPVREGEYEYRGFQLNDGTRLIWNGTQWGYTALGLWFQMAEADGDQWRGLAKEPK